MTQSIVPPKGKGKPLQTEMLEDDIKKRRDLSYKIPEAYRAVESAIPQIGEQAAFFKTFSSFAKTLDVKKDGAVIAGNLEVARVKVGDLLDVIEQGQKALKDVKELELQMSELEDKMNIPMSERWSSLGYAAKGLDGFYEEDFVEADDEGQEDDEAEDDGVAEEEEKQDSI